MKRFKVLDLRKQGGRAAPMYFNAKSTRSAAQQAAKRLCGSARGLEDLGSRKGLRGKSLHTFCFTCGCVAVVG
jgi:hypothetical protein